MRKFDDNFYFRRERELFEGIRGIRRLIENVSIKSRAERILFE